MNVYELNRRQLLYLKRTYMIDNYKSVNISMLDDADGYIPDGIIFNTYHNMMFTEKDFPGDVYATRTTDLSLNALSNCIDVYTNIICPYDAEELDKSGCIEIAKAIDLFLYNADGQYTIDARGNWYEENNKIKRGSDND